MDSFATIADLATLYNVSGHACDRLEQAAKWYRRHGRTPDLSCFNDDHACMSWSRGKIGQTGNKRNSAILDDGFHKLNVLEIGPDYSFCRSMEDMVKIDIERASRIQNPAKRSEAVRKAVRQLDLLDEYGIPENGGFDVERVIRKVLGRAYRPKYRASKPRAIRRTRRKRLVNRRKSNRRK